MGSPGKVWLVGAGPGNPGLITLKGKRALQQADVVFFDRLVNPGILIWAKPGAVLEDVGKEPGGRRVEQSDISKKLIQTAKKGNEVVRLKGGDPYVFGRGGEEALALAKARIPFEVVPGVTAGVAVPATEGIPVTHRGVSTELVFKIGARAEGSVSGKTWVGYMSVEGLGDFLKKAVDAGFSNRTPAAMISKGTCREQKSVFSTVGRLEKAARNTNIKAPALVIVGGVVALRKLVQSQKRGRLAGQRVVLTVSESLGKGWREKFERDGAEVWELPMTRISIRKPQPSWTKDIQQARWLVFTSGAGVRALPGIMGDLRKLAGKKLAVVGKSTASILQSIGLKADFIGTGPGADALAKVWPGKKSETILHATGGAEDGGFTKKLGKRGFQVKRIEVYQNIQPPRPPQVILNALKNDGADWVIFASGTAAERFRRICPVWPKEPKVAVIGPATARVAKRNGWNVRVLAREVSAGGVLSDILKSSS